VWRILAPVETAAHLQLKRLARAYLLREGFAAAGVEVGLPAGCGRADVAGYIDRTPAGPGHNHFPGAGAAMLGEAGGLFARRERVEPRTVIIECKQHRSDFLRDRRDHESLRADRDRLAAVLRRHADRVAAACAQAIADEPQVAVGDGAPAGALFVEPGVDALEADAAWRATAQRLDAITAQLHGNTKFARMTRYRVADRLYVLAPRGLVRSAELPPGWGLLECPARWARFGSMCARRLSELEVRVVREAADLHAHARSHHRLLRGIAIAASREAARADQGSRREAVARGVCSPAVREDEKTSSKPSRNASSTGSSSVRSLHARSRRGSASSECWLWQEL
jgi:hypothetical protein